MSEIIIATSADTPRIFRLTVTRADGKRRRRLVKCPFFMKDPTASYFGLQAKLAELTLGGHIAGHAVRVPAAITASERQRLIRWPEALEGMLA